MAICIIIFLQNGFLTSHINLELRGSSDFAAGNVACSKKLLQEHSYSKVSYLEKLSEQPGS